MQILIGSDLVPTNSNIDLFNKADIKGLLGEELLSIWHSSDFRIFNLEAPLIDTESPIAKCGPNLIAPSSTINGIKDLNPSLITLANNHIFDQSVQGLESTQNILRKYKIPFIGAGDIISEASKPYIFDEEGIKIGFYACAEHEFTIATENRPGANPFDPLESLDHLQNLKEQCDYVIVLYHGGKEHYRYPSPYLQKVCRKMSEKGADLVICQHSHCIGCFEKYKDSTIVYGQGNFLFNKHNNEFWNNSLIIKVVITDSINIKYIPIVKTIKGVRLAEGKDFYEILEAFSNRSKKILQKGFIEKEYRKFAEKSIYMYLRSLGGYGILLSRIDRLLLYGKLTKYKYNEKKLLTIQNFIECEAHRELLLEGIKARRNEL